MFGRQAALAFRNLKRNFLYTLIVIGGLTLGMTTFVAIFQWTAWQYSYDRHFPNAERIFRFTVEEQREDYERHTARILHSDIVKEIYTDNTIPEIEQVARLSPYRHAILRKNDVMFYEDRSYACDTEFLEFFGTEVILGNPEKMLDLPFSIVLTESLARKYFGNEDPIGESFEVMHQFGTEPQLYEITGGIRDFPENSHFKINLLTSFEDPDEAIGTAWVYLLLKDSRSAPEVEVKLTDFIIDRHTEEYYEGLTPRLMPLTDIHLGSHLARELDRNLQFKSVLIIFLAGMLVFLLAWFNFTLLSVSQNQLRIKQFIYQWQAGAGRSAFFRQFFTEYLLSGIISLLFAVVLCILLNGPIHALIGIHLLEGPVYLLLSFGFLLMLLIISSLVTANYTTFRIYNILKRKYLSAGAPTGRALSGRNVFIRFVISLEFLITFVLISNLLMIGKQVNYAIDRQIGANDSTTIQLPHLPRPIVDSYTLFRDQLMEFPVIENVTAMMEKPGGMAMDAFKFTIDGYPATEDRLFVFPVDDNFLDFYDLELIAGSGFPEGFQPDDTIGYYVLNETAAERIAGGNIEDLLGRQLVLDFQYEGFIFPGKIYGVIRDFHLSTMEREINPMVIFPNHVWLYCFSIRTNGDAREAVEALNTTWKELFPDYPLRYYFTDELYNDIYQSELTELKVLIVFSILSLLIAGTGLFALSGFLMNRKMHGAAIRKVSGANVSAIIVSELSQYLLLVSISAAVAIPLSYLAINNWMNNFAYQAHVDLWIFPAIGGLLIVFSWLAVFYHTWRLSNLNPVEFIRSE